MRAAFVAVALCLVSGLAFGQARPPPAANWDTVHISGTETITGQKTFSATNTIISGTKLCLGATCTTYIDNPDGATNLNIATNGWALITSGQLIATSGVSTGASANPSYTTSSNGKLRMTSSVGSGTLLISNVNGIDIGNGTGDESDGTLNVDDLNVSDDVTVIDQVYAGRFSVGANGILGNGTNFLFVNPGSTGSPPIAGVNTCFGNGTSTECDGVTAHGAVRMNGVATGALTACSAGNEGLIQFDTTTHKLVVCDGTTNQNAY